jgi:hypothetical protein
MDILISKADLHHTIRKTAFTSYEEKASNGNLNIVLHTSQGSFSYDILEEVTTEEEKEINQVLNRYVQR